MKKSLDKQDILRDVSFFSGSTYVSQAMFFIRGFLNARILGPSLYGLWSALNIILSYSSYVQLGSLNAMNREIPYQKGRRSKEGMDNTRNVTFTICLVMNMIFSFILMVIALFSWKRFSLNESLGFITIALLSFTFSIYEFYRTSLIAVKDFRLISKANVIFSILSVLLTIVMVPPLKIYGVYIIAVMIPLSSLAYLWFKNSYNLKLDFNLREGLRLIRIGFPLMSIDFLEGSVTSIAGILVLVFLGKTNLAYFSVAILAGRFLMYFPNSIGRTFEPHIYQRYGETHKISALKKYLFKPTLVMALLFPVVAAFYYTGVSFFIRHLLPKYTISIYPLFIILIARFFVSFSPTASVFITAMNKQTFLVPVYICGIVIVFLSGIAFVHMGFGITAIAFALLLAFFFTGSVVFIYALNHYIENGFRSLIYLCRLYLPMLYMVVVIFFNETIISSSSGLFPDLSKLLIKIVVLSIFSAPLVYLANDKTDIASEFIRLLKMRRRRLKRVSLRIREA